MIFWLVDSGSERHSSEDATGGMCELSGRIEAAAAAGGGGRVVWLLGRV